MIAYKVTGNTVKKVECEEMRYPLFDSDGDRIYENTHFSTEKEAYEQAIKECYAGVELITRSIKEIKDALQTQEVKLANKCLDLIRLKKEYESLDCAKE